MTTSQLGALRVTRDGPTAVKACWESTSDDIVSTIIDNERYHRNCLRQLLLQRNELAPVSRLPLEILAKIFSFVSCGRTRSSPIFPCYYFTHVSYSWRSLGLNTPTLWEVLPQDKEWANIMLERSKGADLVIGSVLANDSAERILFLKEVLGTKHTSRIRDLRFSRIKANTLVTLLEDLGPSFLRLQALELTNVLEGSPTSSWRPCEDLQSPEVISCDGLWYSLQPLPALHNLSEAARNPQSTSLHRISRNTQRASCFAVPWSERFTSLGEFQ